MSDFSRVGEFPHRCPGSGCAICALVQRRKAKAAAKDPEGEETTDRPNFTEENAVQRDRVAGKFGTAARKRDGP